MTTTVNAPSLPQPAFRALPFYRPGLQAVSPIAPRREGPAQDSVALRFGLNVSHPSSRDILAKLAPANVQENMGIQDIEGGYPISLRNTMRKDLPVVVIGAGDLYRGKIEKALKHLGADVRILDRDPSRIKPGEKGLSSMEDIPDGAIALVLTPNPSHLKIAKALLKNPKVKGIYLEKPPVISTGQMEELKAVMESSDTPVYLGDHYTFHALPLLALMGVQMPYAPYVQIVRDTPDQALGKALSNHKPLLDDIVSIKGAILQNGTQGNVENRAWLHNFNEGGGMLLDLMVHLLNPLDLLGHPMQDIRKVSLASHKPNQPNGRYKFIHHGDQVTAEDLGRMKGVSSAGAKMDIWVAKYADKKSCFLLLKDKRDYQLKVSFGVSDAMFGKSDVVEYFGPKKNGRRALLGKAALQADPYLLTMDHALNALQTDGPVVLAPEQSRTLDSLGRAQQWVRDERHPVTRLTEFLHLHPKVSIAEA